MRIKVKVLVCTPIMMIYLYLYLLKITKMESNYFACNFCQKASILEYFGLVTLCRGGNLKLHLM